MTPTRCTHRTSRVTSRSGRISNEDGDVAFLPRTEKTCSPDNGAAVSAVHAPWEAPESEDPRARSFHRIIDSIRSLNRPPTWMFVARTSKSDTRKCQTRPSAREDTEACALHRRPTALYSLHARAVLFDRDARRPASPRRAVGLDVAARRPQRDDFIDGYVANDWERDRSTLGDTSSTSSTRRQS